MEKLLGRWPIATVETLPQVIRDLNIKKYDFLQDPQVLSDWLVSASEKERAEASRFAPKPMACRMRLPNDLEGSYFWVEYRDHMTVLVLVQDMVLLTLEYKPGVDINRITVVPISGVPSKKDAPEGGESVIERMNNCVQREVQEEAGYILKSFEFLGEVQKANSSCYRYLGFLEQPLREVPTNRDRLEYMAVVAMSLSDWRSVCRQGSTEYYCIEALADSTTSAAVERLRELGRL